MLRTSFHGNVLNNLRNREIAGLYTLNRRVLRDRMLLQKQFYQLDLKGHYGCVNAIEFSLGLGEYIASGGDDRRVLLWNVAKSLSNFEEPETMIGQHNSNIFCIGFDRCNKKIFSGGNDEQVIIHDVETRKLINVYLHDDVVYGLSTDPNNDHVFASACDDGSAFIYDTRLPNSDAFTLAKHYSPMHSIVYNPIDPRLLATANAKEGIELWDIRKPKLAVMRYGSTVQQSCMNVRISQSGERMLAIRRRLPVVLYDIKKRLPLCEFDHPSYYNSCTMKSCAFAGDNDEYVLSGSDDFNLYMWKIPSDLTRRTLLSSAHAVFKGHRSIVNQVRSNPCNNLIISSGVEKIIKAWSPYEMTESVGVNDERTLYTHEEYINLILNSGHGMSHDYSHRSVDEEPRMMAFFDSLVQREIDGWSSDDELSSNDEELYQRIIQVSQSDSEDTSHSDGERLSPFSRGFVTAMASRALIENTPEGRLLDPRADLIREYEHAVSSSTTFVPGPGASNDSGAAPLNELNGALNELNGALNDDDITSTNSTDGCTSYLDMILNDSTEGKGDNGALSTACLGSSGSCVVNGEWSVDSGRGTVRTFGSSNNSSSDNHNLLDLSHRTMDSSHAGDTASEQITTPSMDDTAMDLSISSGGSLSDITPVEPSLVEHDSRNNNTHSRRRTVVDITGSTINVQMLPGDRSAPTMSRRRISQLIARRRQNSRVKRNTRRISSSDSGDEVSSSEVRARVLRQGAALNAASDTASDAGRADMRKNLRSLLMYSSDEEFNMDNTRETPVLSDLDDPTIATGGLFKQKRSRRSASGNYNDVGPSEVNRIPVNLPNCSADVAGDVNNDCDINIHLNPIQSCDNELCSSDKSCASTECTSQNEPRTDQEQISEPCRSGGKSRVTSHAIAKINEGSTQHSDSHTLQPCTSSMAYESPSSSANSHSDPSYATDSGGHVLNLSLPEVDSGNSQPMWTEFKRFKSRMKKAQRYYRQHAKPTRRRSSDEEDESRD